MQKVSFSLNGFWFHLTLKQNTTYTDQHGMEWYRNGNTYMSQGGGFIHTEKQKQTGLSNKDFFMQEREQRFAYHRQRMIINKNY